MPPRPDARPANPSPRNLRLDQGAATRAALLKAARRLFARSGYHGAGTTEIVAAAGLTRGALYHHFEDKAALFEAVFMEILEEVRARSAVSQPEGPDRWQAHLRLVAESRELQQIFLLDGPAVLGWARWRELQWSSFLGLLVEGVQRRGGAKADKAVIAAHLILAAVSEAGLLVSHADDPVAATREVGEVLTAMVEGLR